MHKANIESAVATALAAGISGAQISIWIDEFLINEVDFIPEETHAEDNCTRL